LSLLSIYVIEIIHDGSSIRARVQQATATSKTTAFNVILTKRTADRIALPTRRDALSELSDHMRRTASNRPDCDGLDQTDVLITAGTENGIPKEEMRADEYERLRMSLMGLPTRLGAITRTATSSSARRYHIFDRLPTRSGIWNRAS
jgi:hypothetical protein